MSAMWRIATNITSNNYIVALRNSNSTLIRLLR